MMALLGYWMAQRYHFSLAALHQVSFGFLLIGLSMACVDISLRGWRIALVAQQVGEKLSWWQGVRICLAVDFFAAITPARLGGEPARMVGLLRNGLNASKALIVLGLEGMMDLGYLFLALPLFLLLSSNHESHLVKVVRDLIGGGLLLIGVPTLLLMLREGYVKKSFAWMRRHVPNFYYFISGMGRWSPVRKVLALRANMLVALKGPWWNLPLGIAITGSWWAVRFASLIWIGAALGFELRLADVFWPQFLIYNSMIFTPVPVSGGLFEASFLLLYEGLIPQHLLASAVVLWRFFAFYIFIVLGAVSTTRSMWRLTMRKLETPDPALATKELSVKDV